jgi:hypothetical protein
MACKLNSMWKLQEEQQADFNLDPKAMSPIGKDSVAMKLLLGLNEEVAKLARCSSHYKLHILKSPAIDKRNVSDAVVDIMKYVISIAQLYGLSDEDIYDSFYRKTEVVRDKAKGERLELERNTKVLLIDIDNVLADLTDWDKGLKRAKGEDVVGMGDKIVEMIESMKKTFYQDGGFLTLKTVEGASVGLKKLREYGWKIVLVSARPYWQYQRIHADTVQWLRDNDMEYDLLLFNKDKAEAIYESIFPAMPSYMIEDREKHAIEVSELGVKVLLLSYPYNESAKENRLVRRVNSWDEIIKIIGKPE